jgi:Cu+-exporting ATPase
MTRRFWIAVLLPIPVFALGMSDLIPGQPLQRVIPMNMLQWVQLVLATPVVLWAGWPFSNAPGKSIVNRSLNCLRSSGSAWVLVMCSV